MVVGSRVLGVDGFILCRWISSRVPWELFYLFGVVGFTRTYVPWGSIGSFRDVGFAHAHHACRWVYPVSLGSLACTLGVVGYIRDRWVHSRALWGSLGSSGVVEFTRVRPGCRWVHPVSSGSLARALEVIGFIRGRWFHSQAP